MRHTCCRHAAPLKLVPNDAVSASQKQLLPAGLDTAASCPEVPADGHTDSTPAAGDSKRTGSHCTVRLGHSKACVTTRSAQGKSHKQVAAGWVQAGRAQHP